MTLRSLVSASRTVRRFAGVAIAALVAVASADAGAMQIVMYKIGANATGANAVGSAGNDVYTAWANSGGFNMSNPAAPLLTDTTTDYKNSWVDSAANWATVISVNVGMYVGGVEVASMNFAPGADKNSFYAPANLTGTSYTDLSAGGFAGNYFSEAGDPTYGRRWFVNQNYGGCGSDTGWLVVEGSAGPCGWESGNLSAAGRLLLYATGNTRQNYNSANVASAGVFAITVTTADVPEPASLGFAALAMVGLGAARGRFGRKG